MNRAEARIKNFQNSKTRFMGMDSHISFWLQDAVASDEIKFSKSMGRKKKKSKK